MKKAIPLAVITAVMLLSACDMIFGFKLLATTWKATLTLGTTTQEMVVNFAGETEGTSITYQDGVAQPEETFTYTWDSFSRTGTVTNPDNDVYTIYLSDDRFKLIAEIHGMAIIYNRQY